MHTDLTVSLLYQVLLFRKAGPHEVKQRVKNLGPGLNCQTLEQLTKNIINSRDSINKYRTNQQYLIALSEVETNNARDILSAIDSSTSSSYLRFLAGILHLSLHEYRNAISHFKHTIDSDDVLLRLLSSRRLRDMCEADPHSRDLYYSIEKRAESVLNSARKHDSIAAINDNLMSHSDNSVSVNQHIAPFIKQSDVLSDMMGEHLRFNAHNTPLYLAHSIVTNLCRLKGIDQKNSTILADSFSLIFKESSLLGDDFFAPDTISIGGFHYSGSSAVHDFLCDTDSVSTTKMECASYIGGLSKILAGKDSFSSPRQGVIDYFLIHIVNSFVTGGVRHKNRMAHRLLSRALRDGESRLGVFSKAVRTFMASVAAAQMSNERDQVVKDALAKLLYDCSEINPGSGRLVLDQAPTAMGLKRLNNLPKRTKYIAVFRDPRDLFVDQIKHGAIGRGRFRDVDGFVDRYLKDRRQYFDTKKTLTDSYDFLETSFENFILQPEERLRIARFADVPLPSESKRFDPTKSARNIGMFKDYKNQNDIRVIEERLSDYLGL